MNRHFRKLLTAVMALCLILALLAGCGSTQSGTGSAGSAADSGEKAGDASAPDLSVSDISASDTSKDNSGETAPAEEKSDIIVLYTNDVHCGVDDNIGYAGLSAYRKSLEAEGYDVLLVDAGDSIQGGIIGTLTKGEAVVRLMNQVGYDAATLGNHEFDYGVDRLLELSEMADYPYIACNFVKLDTGEAVFDPYTILEAGGKKIAFIGVATPESFHSSTPTYFQDEQGNYIYGFSEDEDGTKLREVVQTSVDSARQDGADYVILLTHLGIGSETFPYMSTELIPGISGVDAVIDGHSHSTVEMELVKDREGKGVLLTQTGTKLAAIGKLTISGKGEMTSELISDYEEKDPQMDAAIKTEQAGFEEVLSKTVGHTDYPLVVTDENGNRIVRNGETNLGDLVADAYRYAAGAEIGFSNGGGVRADIPAGDIQFRNLLDVTPFSNTLACSKVTGQMIADALEYAVSKEPEEFGGFLQVSGLTYTINMEKTADITLDAEGLLVSVNDGDRRVENIMVNGESLDPERTYTVAATEYVMFSGGDGNTAFKNGEKVDIPFLDDVQAIELYIQESLGGVVPESYADPYGEGRITIINSEMNAEQSTENS